MSFALALSSQVSAQVKDLQWWGNYTYNHTINDQWQVSSRLEMRYIDLSENFYRTGISPSAHYQPKPNLKYLAGCRFFYYATASRDGVMEYRPWLGLKYAKSSPPILSLSHQLLWEQRIISTSNSTYESRLRYKFKVGTTLFKNKDHSLKIAFAPELFWSFGVFNDVSYKNTRWGFPVSYQYSEKIVMEVVPFLQTNHNGMLRLLDDRFGVIQLNVKTFL
ncbi:MAG: DUF2490 domain-containing protein [Bacteroidales bacterium]|nr:DUF2490 domain-containing protein [Bacteroidales bacterium]